MMPNKTIYVKDADVPLFERAQQELGDSVSALFAEFLQERVGKRTPHERRIIDFVNEIAKTRQAVKKDRSLPGFIDGEYDEATGYAEKALRHLRAGEVARAKVMWHAATRYSERAERDVKETKELGAKIAELLRAAKRATKP